MLEYDALRVINDHVNIYKNFPLPAVVFSRDFEVCYANKTAMATYPAVCDAQGIASMFAEYDIRQLFSKLEKEGSCTIMGALPFSEVNITLLPILAGGIIGVILLMINAQACPETGAAYLTSRSAESLSWNIRECVDGIFSSMDATSVKAGLLHAGWVKSSLSRIGLDCYRILRIAENVSEYSKFQSGAINLHLSTTDISEKLREMSDTVSEVGKLSNVPVEFEISDEMCPINADLSRLELALFNLIHNSIYFTRPGNTIKVIAEKSGNAVMLSVHDHGIGIPREVLADVWRPYASYDHGRRGAGVGLGLAIVKAVVTAHAGECEISSREGVGTSVIMRLPAAAFSSSLTFRRDDDYQSRMDNRFSRLYIGLTGAMDSPYNEYIQAEFKQ